MEYIIEYLDMVILFSASFLLVGLLGLQSKNVQGSKYAAAALTSIAITVANFFFITIGCQRYWLYDIGCSRSRRSARNRICDIPL